MGKLFQRLRDLEAKATPGPWELEQGHLDDEDVQERKAEGRRCHAKIGPIESCDGCPIGTDADASLVAELRVALPKLLQVIDLYEEVMRDVVAYESKLSEPERSYICDIEKALKKALEIENG